MESSSSRKSLNREKFVRKAIWPAIQRQSCPICLKNLDDRRAAVITVCMHAYCLECIRKWSDLKRRCPLCNADFDSWFYRINLSSGKFLKQQLPALSVGKKVISEAVFSLRDRHRIIRSSRNELSSVSWRTKPLPWRRSFGRPGSVPSNVIAERKIQWRASVYNRRLQAVPLSPRNCHEQNISGNSRAKERILQRIEPWIQRELQAILGDPDPSIIVHVASTLFIASFEGKFNVPSGQLCDGDEFFAPLQPFLQNRTNMFWHELRCFAESSVTMETYDALVEYKRLN